VSATTGERLSLALSDAILCAAPAANPIRECSLDHSSKDNPMPISTSSFGDERDGRYNEYESPEQFETESMDFPGLSAESAETLLKRLGGGVAEKNSVIEGIGWKAFIHPNDGGVTVQFDAHDELLDDLIRRFEEMAARAV
jgi:hypothetical protein